MALSIYPCLQRIKEFLNSWRFVIALFLIFLTVWLVSSFDSSQSEAAASWVQAIGSILAILIVLIPVTYQNRIARKEARAMVIAATQLAHATMREAWERAFNPEHAASEWDVIQWDFYQKLLDDAPIFTCGSKEAVIAFTEFRALFSRVQIFANHDVSKEDGTLPSFSMFIMQNASLQIERLEKSLK